MRDDAGSPGTAPCSPGPDQLCDSGMSVAFLCNEKTSGPALLTLHVLLYTEHLHLSVPGAPKLLSPPNSILSHILYPANDTTINPVMQPKT